MMIVLGCLHTCLPRAKDGRSPEWPPAGSLVELWSSDRTQRGTPERAQCSPEAAGTGADLRSAVRRSRAPHQVVIVGCGFAGLSAAQALRRAPVEVTVIDRNGGGYKRV